MSEITTTTPSSATTRGTAVRRTGRWMITFVGFPAGGLVAELLVGPVNSVWAAMVGGLISGLFIGAAQWWGMGRNAPSVVPWIAATAIGFMVGLGVGTAVVDYATSLQALVVQGAIGGFAVGAAQALVLRGKLGRLALVWPPALAAAWAIGWAVTTSIGVQVDLQFTVFGSAGAIVVTALTLVLPFTLNRPATGRR
jgi:hypothetical protein